MYMLIPTHHLDICASCDAEPETPWERGLSASWGGSLPRLSWSRDLTSFPQETRQKIIYLSSEPGAWKWVWQPSSDSANPEGIWGLHSAHSMCSAFCLTTEINSHYKRRKLNWTVLSNFVCKGSRPWAVTKGWDVVFSRYISKKKVCSFFGELHQLGIFETEVIEI